MSAKIRALAVWIQRPGVMHAEGVWIAQVGVFVYLDEALQIHRARLAPDDDAPAFEVVSHPRFFVEIDDEPGSYRLKPKPEVREIPPEGLGGDGVTITCKQNEKRNES